MSLEDVRKLKVLPLAADEHPGNMEPVALYGPDGQPLLPEKSIITLKLDDILDAFEPNFRVPSETEAEGYTNEVLCWTDGVMMHYRGDIIHVGDMEGGLVATFKSEYQAFGYSTDLGYVVGYGAGKRALLGSHTYPEGLSIDFNPLDPAHYSDSFTAGGDGLVYPTIFGSYLLASAVV